MRLNLKKCKVLHFGRINPKALYILGDKSGQIKEIGHSNTERDLGVMKAEDMKWKNYINHDVNNTNDMTPKKKPSKTWIIYSGKTRTLQ